MQRLLLIFLISFFSSALSNSKEKITSLPGLNIPLNFSQYTGYVTVDQQSGRNLFFWYVETEADPELAPLLLWLTGGPGCSGLLALFYENGPFSVNSDGTGLNLNPYSWNKYANVIYLESPSGVGFSYSLNRNYTTGDTQTANDNYEFLKGFFQLFPERRNNPFFVAGESYAGNYVPQLVNLIVRGSNLYPIPLVGFMVGNPTIDLTISPNYYIPFMANHGFVGIEVYSLAQKLCSGNFSHPPTEACKSIIGNITKNFADINPYNVYQPCIGTRSSNGACFTFNYLSSKIRSQTIIPCLDLNNVAIYINRPDVQEAIYVSKYWQSLNNTWIICSDILHYVEYTLSVVPIYKYLNGFNLRILVYSGDVDTCLTYLGTEACVDSLDYELSEAWRPWLLKDQVAGFVKRYERGKFSFLTVKGAGHMVPNYKPEEALQMFERFLLNKSF